MMSNINRDIDLYMDTANCKTSVLNQIESAFGGTTMASSTSGSAQKRNRSFVASRDDESAKTS